MFIGIRLHRRRAPPPLGLAIGRRRPIAALTHDGPNVWTARGDEALIALSGGIESIDILHHAHATLHRCAGAPWKRR